MDAMHAERDIPEDGELEFFGVKLKVKNSRLAELLNSSVGEDVQVIGARAREAFAHSDDGCAEREVERRVSRADASIRIRLEEAEDS